MAMDPAIGAALINAGGSLLGDSFGFFSSPTAGDHSSYKYTKRLMDYQAKLQENYARFSALQLPGLNRQGMELAGFNPILAINAGAGEQGNSSIANFDNHPDDGFSRFGAGFSDAVQSAVSTALQYKRFAAETALFDAQSKHLNAQTAESIYRVKHPSSLISAMQSLTDSDYSRVGRWISDLFKSVTAKMNFSKQIQFNNYQQYQQEWPGYSSPYFSRDYNSVRK